MITMRRFGRTEHRSTRTIFGGAALYEGSPEKADRCLELLLRYGVNHIDTAADYGEAESWIGRWMGQHRERFFLATKTSARDYQGAKKSIRESLDRLRVDRVDLMQLHCLIDPGHWEEALGAGGALEAILEARDQGLTRFVGVTAHEVVAPAMLLKSLGQFDFDSVLLPYSFPMMQLQAYAEKFEKLLAECHIRDVPVQTTKSIARRPKRGRESGYTTWYEPLMEQSDIDRAVHWVLGREDVFLNTAADLNLLSKVLDAASRFESGNRPSDAEMEELVASREMERIFQIERVTE